MVEAAIGRFRSPCESLTNAICCCLSSALSQHRVTSEQQYWSEVLSGMVLMFPLTQKTEGFTTKTFRFHHTRNKRLFLGGWHWKVYTLSRIIQRIESYQMSLSIRALMCTGYLNPLSSQSWHWQKSPSRNKEWNKGNINNLTNLFSLRLRTLWPSTLNFSTWYTLTTQAY